MPAVVLVGHDHDCPMCGPTTINSGTRNVTVNGRAVARVGDALGCGAVITSGSPSRPRRSTAASTMSPRKSAPFAAIRGGGRAIFCGACLAETLGQVAGFCIALLPQCLIALPP